MAKADGTELFLEQWRKQAETGVRMMDAIIEATVKVREAQLAAAQETHARAQALQQALATAKNAQEMWGEQWNWMLGSNLPAASIQTVDNACREMMKASQQFLQSATSAFAPPATTVKKESKKTA